jgi:hypothetical protein
MVNTDWNTPRRTEQCAACAHAFDVGETFQTCLYEAPEGYERRDFCLACPVPDTPPAIGAWRTRRPEPAGRNPLVFDKAAMYKLFQRLEGDDDPQRLRLRFVLGLLLWRKRTLKLEHTTRQDEGEVWHYGVPRADTTHAVLRPELSEDELESLSTQLEQLMDGAVADLDPVTAELATEEPDETV